MLGTRPAPCRRPSRARRPRPLGGALDPDRVEHHRLRRQLGVRVAERADPADDVHAVRDGLQALRYASYCARFGLDDVIDLLIAHHQRDHQALSREQALHLLEEHVVDAAGGAGERRVAGARCPREPRPREADRARQARARRSGDRRGREGHDLRAAPCPARAGTGAPSDGRARQVVEVDAVEVD
jgi:hypothetical protein